MGQLEVEIQTRLPWDRPSDSLRYSATLKGVELLEDDYLDGRVVAMVAYHLRLLCAHDEDAALLNIGLWGSDGLACFAVMAGNQWLADLDGVHADQREVWLAAA